MGYKEWVTKQKGNPVLLVGSIVGFTITFWLSYKNFFSPWFQQRRLKENEYYANVLMKKPSEN